MPKPAAPKPAKGARPWQLLAATLYLVLAVPILLAGRLYIPAAVLAGMGGLLVWSAVRRARFTPATELIGRTLQLIAQGRLDEAEAVLDAVPEEERHGLMGMAVLLQRASLRFVQGEVAEALALADAVTRESSPLLFGAQNRQFLLGLSGLRTVLLGAGGDPAAALAEAARLESDALAGPPQRAQAALARALVHARANDRAALAAELERSRMLLTLHAGSEAALVRTMSRLAATPSEGAYRSQASAGHELSALGRWVVKVLPSAAAYAPRKLPDGSTGALGPLPSPSPEASARVGVARAEAKRAARSGAKWVQWLFVASFTAMVGTGALAALGGVSYLVPGAVFVMVVALYAWWVRSDRSMLRALQEARTHAALGDDAAADALFQRVGASHGDLRACQALLERAQHAERLDDLGVALAAVDQGLGRLERSAELKNALATMLLPSLVTMRARLLAAIGRTDEALAEMAVLAAEHPGYAFAPRAEWSVRLILALRSGDRALARALVLSRPNEMNLPPNFELLAAVVLAADGVFEADGERERIAHDLAVNPGVRAWIERIAPGLCGALRTETGVRAVADADADDDAGVHEAPETRRAGQR